MIAEYPSYNDRHLSGYKGYDDRLMKRKRNLDDQNMAVAIEALLDEGEVLLWWDKLSDRSIMGGVGRTLTLFTLAVNLAILTLIFLPSFLPETSSLSWLLLPLLLIDCLCLFFIMLYFAFGLMTGGVNVMSDRRVLVVDLHRRKTVRFMSFDVMCEIRLSSRRGDRGDILFLRDEARREPATALNPRRLSLQGVRHFSRVVALLSEQSNLANDTKS